MPFAAALSTASLAEQALNDCFGQLHWQGPVDLALTFYSPHHCAAAANLARELSARLKPRALAGCPGESIIGNEREVEGGPALCVWLARWATPVIITSFALSMEPTSEGFSLLGWPDELIEANPKESWLLTLADPFTFPIDDFLGQVNEEKKGLRVVGGMASAARSPGQNPLLWGERVLDRGAVCVLLRGPIPARSVVSQGCRPIGKPLVVTKARDNLILELGGKPAFAQLQELWQQLSPRDQQLVQQGLHIGRVISEYQESFHRGDFLVRNVMGIDRDSGALAITERVCPGQTVQFHVRDAATADEDLRLLLEHDKKANATAPAAGLLFSCNGRGTRLFDAPHHDAKAVQAGAGGLPLAGFFAAGELGPVGGQNFIHGFTASLVLFEE
ncbi:MAG: FIST C-terminal domain-containing protein [Gemmataceae bacterium]|nr:FIST C-terminal domain-containing protein [Gemmataceae bacterium]MCI0738831.1 FIST C-terminal domain-containing protein [Gemmataceae bacterium]